MWKIENSEENESVDIAADKAAVEAWVAAMSDADQSTIISAADATLGISGWSFRDPSGGASA